MFAGIFGAILIAEENGEEDQEDQEEYVQDARIVNRNLRDISDPFSYDDEYFRLHYRLTKHLVHQLILQLQNHVDIQRSTAIPLHLQVLGVLRFLAEGQFQKGAAREQSHPMSQPSMSRCIDRIINGILQLENNYIQFPRTRVARETQSNRFLNFIRIPGVIGLIDCFLVSCIRPTENEEAFYNYKAGPSVNVQIIVDSNYIIQNVYVCPGSNNDCHVWNVCEMKSFFLSLRNDPNVEGPYYLLGDSGYSPSEIMLTPVLNAIPGSREAAFTHEHTSTRCKVEQTIGMLTNLWMAIKRARMLCYQPEKVAGIVKACIILYNFRLLNGIPYPQMDCDCNARNENLMDQGYAAGIAERNRLIAEHY